MRTKKTLIVGKNVLKVKFIQGGSCDGNEAWYKIIIILFMLFPNWNMTLSNINDKDNINESKNLFLKI